MTNTATADLTYILTAKAAARRVIGKRRGKFAFFYGMDGKTVFRLGQKTLGGYYLKSGKDEIFGKHEEIVILFA